MGSFDLQKESLDNYSLTGRVFNRIREDILSGKYKQNEELKETAIGKELGVSRTPVREALRQLEFEGLVNIIPNKGAYVTGITEKDIKDIYVVRSLLEGLCARWAAENISNEQLEELDEIVHLSEFYAKKESFEHVVDLDNKFHEVIYTASKSRILEDTLTDLHHYVERVRKVTLAVRERAERSNTEHKDILEAIRSRDGKLAEKLANKHIMNTIKNLSNQKLADIIK